VGLNHEHGWRVVLDIETAPLPDAADYLEAIEPPSNYRDPEKVAAYLAEKRAEQLERCSLDPDLCRIVAVGWWRERESQPTTATVETQDEAALLKTFWQHVEQGHLVGFNCIAFDLPVLLRRSLYLGLTAPTIQCDRFRHPRVTDVLQVLSHHGALRFRSLDFYAKRFGFDVPADGLTGKDIARAVAEGRWADVERHVRADVCKTAQLAARLGWFTPTIIAREVVASPSR
jgi:hypothetical protein